MADDLTQQITALSDETTFDRSGQPIVNKKITFYLGKFGPFVERIPAADFSMTAAQQRIDQVKMHLQGLTR